ncbi:hypothetical protein ACJRO7_029114 [Eucalyptus globulus]|uniref:Uncharacterized protein n=1 Tax=Eucalyptus globulus TaxID=34317 RepID=A0ABD3JXC4_EUCGL
MRALPFRLRVSSSKPRAAAHRAGALKMAVRYERRPGQNRLRHELPASITSSPLACGGHRARKRWRQRRRPQSALFVHNHPKRNLVLCMVPTSTGRMPFVSFIGDLSTKFDSVFALVKMMENPSCQRRPTRTK